MKPVCATEGCKAKGAVELIHHHHDGHPDDCPINEADDNHCIYWLCQRHLDEAIDYYPESFPTEYEERVNKS
jgi:hypothetical protein